MTYRLLATLHWLSFPFNEESNQQSFIVNETLTFHVMEVRGGRVVWYYFRSKADLRVTRCY